MNPKQVTRTYITIHIRTFKLGKNVKISHSAPAYVTWAEQDEVPNEFAGLKPDGTLVMWTKTGLYRVLRTSQDVYTEAEALAIKAEWKAEFRSLQAGC